MREGFHLFEWDAPTRRSDRHFGHRTIDSHHFQGSRGLQATVRDITEQRRAETELRACVTFQRAILDNAGCDYFLADPTASLNYLIPQRRPCSDTAPTKWWAFHHPASFTFREEVVTRAKQFSEEFRCTVAPGSDVFVEKCPAQSTQ